MNPIIVAITKFIAVTIASGLVGYFIIWSWLGVLLFVCLAVIAQIVLGWVLNYYEYVRRLQYAYRQRLDEDAILAANVITVECAGCKTQHSIPIVASERNLFRCRKCEGENVIIVTAETALTTNLEHKNA